MALSNFLKMIRGYQNRAKFARSQILLTFIFLILRLKKDWEIIFKPKTIIYLSLKFSGVPVNTAMQDPSFQTGFMQVPVEVVPGNQTRPNHSRPRRQRY